MMGQESVMRRADVLGHQILAYANKPISIEGILKRLMSVSRTEVQNTAKKLFTRRPMVAALGPLDGLESYRKIAARLK